METNAIIICTKDRINDTIQSIQSVSKQSLPPKEIIIIDSSKYPLNKNIEFKKIFNKETFKSSNLIYKHTASGLPLQRNIGIASATSDIIHFIDDDSILEKNYLEEMSLAFEKHPSYIGGMGYITNIGKKYYNFERLIRTLFLLQKDHASGKFTYSGMPTHPYGTTTFKNVEIVGGCCMSFRKKYLLDNLFDENLTKYASMEDCDIAKRMTHKGKLFFNPKARQIHNNSPIAREVPIASRAMYIRNYRYLFFKNFYPENKVRIIAHWWSIIGLFALALYKRDSTSIKGYLNGLWIPLLPRQQQIVE
ncbi:MAG: glycosyltransferase involved in cell wall biosynthesis [Alteromonas naphthalenivorans]|jgi:glycosyltransferase involved in cell wall biosynthesis